MEVVADRERGGQEQERMERETMAEETDLEHYLTVGEWEETRLRLVRRSERQDKRPGVREVERQGTAQRIEPAEQGQTGR
jgi:hypothetical protein